MINYVWQWRICVRKELIDMREANVKILKNPNENFAILIKRIRKKTKKDVEAFLGTIL